MAPTWALRLAVTHRDKLRGMLGREESHGIWLLAPCCDIHTVGMRCDLDVAFLARDGTVLEAVAGLKAGRRMRVPEAVAVLERRALREPWYRPGDRVVLGCLRAPDAMDAAVMPSEARTSCGAAGNRSETGRLGEAAPDIRRAS